MLSILIPCYEYKITDLVFALSKMMANETLSYEIIALDDGSKSQDIIISNQDINSMSNCKPFIINFDNVLAFKNAALNFETRHFIDIIN